MSEILSPTSQLINLNGFPQTIVCDEHKTTGIFSVNHGQPEMTLLAMIGDGGTLQLALVGESSRIMLGVDAGARIAVHWT